MATLAQRSFSGGEITPSLYARVDVSKYLTGLRTCRNNLVMRHGGAENRAGTKFIAEVKDSTANVRLIPFIFNSAQTYVLEFGDNYMRVHQDGVQLTLTAQNISTVSQADPAVLTYSGSDTYANGDEVYITGVVGMSELNGRNFKVSNVDTGANTFELQTMDSVDLDSTGYGAYSSGGTVEEVYEISTPYDAADLDTLQFVQSADIITIVHPNYAPMELARTGHTSWTLTRITFAPDQAAPTSLGGSGGSGTNWVYHVTALNDETFEESLALSGTLSLSADPTATPHTVTWAAASGASEYNVYIEVDGVPAYLGAARGTSYKNEVDPATADKSDTPPTARNPFDDKVQTITNITQANPAVVTVASTTDYTNGDVLYITEVVGMTEVNNRSFTIANKTGTTFELQGEDSTSHTAYSSGGKVGYITDNPSAVTYYQQRLTFGNTSDDPEKIWTSQSGNFKNFTRSSPIQDDDAVTWTMVGRQVNSIKSLLDIGKLIVFTDSGEWAIHGDDAGILKPTAINQKQHSYNGSGDRPPIVVGGNALYLQSRGSIVRDLGFDFQADGYRGNDLTIFSAHLFDDYTIDDWAYQQVPHSVLWLVRSDGTLLGLTYVREQQMLAWHRHDFEGGTVENVCVVPEGQEDVLYVVVNRTINGRATKYIERFSERHHTDVKDYTFMDSYLSYDGRITDGTTVTISGGTNWDQFEELTLTASANQFANTDDGVHVTGADGTIIRFSDITFSSATVVTGRPHKTVPTAMRSTALSTWAIAVSDVTGLWHLEGEEVSALGDGFVASNPSNASYTTVTVTAGTATFDKAYTVLHVGLPYISDLETLDLDSQDIETMMDKQKKTDAVTVYTHNTRGLWAGYKAPSDDDTDPLEDLTEYKMRNDEDYDSPIDLNTGPMSVNIKQEWNNHGRTFVRQVDPLPASILAIAPSGTYPLK